jgi:hypothetical protein
MNSFYAQDNFCGRAARPGWAMPAAFMEAKAESVPEANRSREHENDAR